MTALHLQALQLSLRYSDSRNVCYAATCEWCVRSGNPSIHTTQYTTPHSLTLILILNEWCACIPLVYCLCHLSLYTQHISIVVLPVSTKTLLLRTSTWTKDSFSFCFYSKIQSVCVFKTKTFSFNIRKTLRYFLESGLRYFILLTQCLVTHSQAFSGLGLALHTCCIA